MESSLRRAPKILKENIAYRKEILRRATGNPEFQYECWLRAKRDPIWFCDTFGFTHSPMKHTFCPDRLFVLYDFQEQVVKKLLASIGLDGSKQHDLLCEKSRDMGLTWIVVMVSTWLWAFNRGVSVLYGSNKEENVDMAGNPASIMGKVDYFLDKMPAWLPPRYQRVRLMFTNLDNDSIIKGESANDNFGRSGRFGLVFMDEFPAVEHGEKLLAATQRAAAVRWLVGTHQGANTAFNQQAIKMRRETPERVLRLPWHLHPEFNPGLYTSNKDEYGRYVLDIIDKAYPWPKSSDGTNIYPFVLDGKVRSPWYDEECRRSHSDQIIAQELDINPASSGSPLIQPDKLAAIIARSARAPRHIGELTYLDDGSNPKFVESPEGRLRLWCELDKNGLPPEGKYGVAGDVAFGNGGVRSSNSAATAVNRKTGAKVAEFAWFEITPQDFAIYAVALARFFGDAALIWEIPGPGTMFWTALKKLNYPNLYVLPGAEGRRGGMKYGWQPSEDEKRTTLENYAYALHNGHFENPSIEALKECSEYERTDDRRIVHAKSDKSSNPDEAGKNHGDRVIADALAYLMVDEQPKKGDLADLLRSPPPGTYAWRQKEHRDRLKRQGRYGVRRNR